MKSRWISKQPSDLKLPSSTEPYPSTVRSPNDEFRPCEGMTQDERLPGPEAILSI
jgi:hypothetical protein